LAQSLVARGRGVFRELFQRGLGGVAEKDERFS
jgi:hypothetical protein